MKVCQQQRFKGSFKRCDKNCDCGSCFRDSLSCGVLFHDSLCSRGAIVTFQILINCQDHWQYWHFCHFYRPQGNIFRIFSEACVKNSVHRGGGVSRPSPGGLQAHTRGVYPSMYCGRHPPRGRLLPRAVRILLECILVFQFSQFSVCVCVCVCVCV